MNDAKPKFSPTFSIKDYAQTFREILVFQINRKGVVNTDGHFWEAQREITKLRKRLQDAYESAMKKRLGYVGRISDTGGNKTFLAPDKDLEIWMYGAAVYELITEQGRRLEDVLNMAWSDITAEAINQGAALKARAEQEGEQVYTFTKKSREKD